MASNSIESFLKWPYINKQSFLINWRNNDFLSILWDNLDTPQWDGLDPNWWSTDNKKNDLEDQLNKEKGNEEKTIELNFSKVTIDTSKLDFDKKIKSLEKAYPDSSIRIEVYKGIRRTHFLRKQMIAKGKLSNESKSILLDIYNYMIDTLDQKIKNLE